MFDQNGYDIRDQRPKKHIISLENSTDLKGSTKRSLASGVLASKHFFRGSYCPKNFPVFEKYLKNIMFYVILQKRRKNGIL